MSSSRAWSGKELPIVASVSCMQRKRSKYISNEALVYCYCVAKDSTRVAMYGASLIAE